MTADAERRTVSLLRKGIVGLIIVAFGLAALGGIIVLLGGDLGSEAGRVLSTTAVVGAFSVAVLCCVALAGRRVRVFGAIGAVIAVATAGLVIRMIWWQSDWPVADVEWKLVWTGVAATAACSLASLLLLLADRRRSAVRVGLWITLGLFAVVLGMVLYLIWSGGEVDDEVFPRALGVFGILAALGAVVVPVLSLLMPDAGRVAPLPAELTTRLRAEADRRGVTVEELLAPVLGPPAASTPPVSAPPLPPAP